MFIYEYDFDVSLGKVLIEYGMLTISMQKGPIQTVSERSVNGSQFQNQFPGVKRRGWLTFTDIKWTS